MTPQARALVEETLAHALARESLRHPKHADILGPLRKRLERILIRRWNKQQKAFIAEARHWLGKFAAGHFTEADNIFSKSVMAKINAGTALSQPPSRNDTDAYAQIIEDAFQGGAGTISVDFNWWQEPYKYLRDTEQKDALEGIGGGIGPGFRVYQVPVSKLTSAEDITGMPDKMVDMRAYAKLLKSGSEPPALFGHIDPDTGEVTLMSGSRRLLAAEQAGVEYLPVAIPEMSTAAEAKEIFANIKTAEDLGSQFAKDYLKDQGFHQLAADIDATTRERMGNAVSEIFAKGGTLDDAVSAIKEAFSDMKESRAATIAQTELADAYNQALLSSAKETGGELLKTWNLDGEGCVEICQPNEADGAIDLDEDFSSGDDAPPAHPNCDCSIGFVRSSE